MFQKRNNKTIANFVISLFEKSVMSRCVKRAQKYSLFNSPCWSGSGARGVEPLVVVVQCVQGRRASGGGKGVSGESCPTTSTATSSSAVDVRITASNTEFGQVVYHVTCGENKSSTINN